MNSEQISEYIQLIKNTSIDSLKELDEFKINFLSKKGIISELFQRFKTYEGQDKKMVGKSLNDLKNIANQLFEQAKASLNSIATDSSLEASHIDYTLPGEYTFLGSRHPISLVKEELVNIFDKLGFTQAYDTEIEDDFHNFGALNFPEHHPARDMQDTFFVKTYLNKKMLLRTHTSSVQIRLMQAGSPPFRVIMPGRVYRNETISARAHCFFHQIEGLYVHKNVSFKDLKQTVVLFIEAFFNCKDVKSRFRPSFFPFTEPSAEVDIACLVCSGKGCNICKYTGWLEIMGCGLVHPNVLQNCNISLTYSGFAFGMGIERLAMLKYNYIKDLRIFYDNDLDFLKSFSNQII